MWNSSRIFVHRMMSKRVVFLFLMCVLVGASVWAVVHLAGPNPQNGVESSEFGGATPWTQAVEKVQEPREPDVAIQTPPELRHYTERYWFLATQVAEVEEHDIPTCQDFLELASMITRGEMVPLPAVTDSYVLYKVGEKADGSDFTRYEENQSAALYSNFWPEVRFATQPAPQHTIGDYETLRTLAKNFGGRSYDLASPDDRKAMKVHMLSSLRPQALRIMEDVATAYHRQFDRPLPVSSLVRPEQYQHELRKVNRNAVLIETPPHTTGLAFDIDYRYMSGGEQNFVMNELARLKREGRIEVIRESNANYHVFAFLNGSRPSDELIKASLEKAGAPVDAAEPVAEVKEDKKKGEKSTRKKVSSKPRKRR